MAIVDFSDLLKHASEHRYALTVFQIASLAELNALISAAHAQRASLILAPMPSAKESGVARALFAACEVAASEAAVPVALLGFPGDTADSSTTYINQGCGALHITPAPAHFPDAVDQVKALTVTGKQCGIAMGALLPGPPIDAPSQEHDTKPTVAECIAFAQRTDLDFLEVDWLTYSEGKKRRGKVDYDRLKRIGEALGRKLLIRAEEDVPPEQIFRLIDYGVTLVCQPPSYAVQDIPGLQDYFKAWGSAGRAAEVLAHCQPWRTIHHVIEFNVRPDALTEINNVLALARERLATIPGVRRVATGKAINANARYQFCWIMTLASEKAATYYRAHPTYVEFADSCFRPIADDRLSIDFRITAP